MIKWRIPFPQTQESCGTCGTEFTKVRSNHRFCSLSCWQPPKPKPEKFWKKVEKSDGCWLWLGRKQGKGYGKQGDQYAHRLAWELAYGTIPKGLFVCHHCDNPSCVRPDHLFLGTADDNQQDMVRKGRSPRGDRSGARKHPERMRKGESISWHKLTADNVRSIRKERAEKGTTYAAMAEHYGVHPMTVSQIFKGKAWKSVQ